MTPNQIRDFNDKCEDFCDKHNFDYNLFVARILKENVNAYGKFVSTPIETFDAGAILGEDRVNEIREAYEEDLKNFKVRVELISNWLGMEELYVGLFWHMYTPEGIDKIFEKDSDHYKQVQSDFKEKETKLDTDSIKAEKENIAVELIGLTKYEIPALKEELQEKTFR
ncbi:MAG: hypothetical protein LBN07_01250 [Christensenellaceae bacterium]|jgi:hypothetical protein|nr:hypothetical protein [Christensenellaceae bacterium]